MSFPATALAAPKVAVTKQAADVYVENGEKDQGYHFVRKVKVSVNDQGGTCRSLEGFQIDPSFTSNTVGYKTAAAQLAQDGYVPVKIGEGKDAVTLFIKKKESKDTFANKDMTLHNVLSGKSTDKAPTSCSATPLKLVSDAPPKTTGAAAPKPVDMKTPPEWLKGDCVRVRIGQVVSWYPIVAHKDGVKVTFKNDKGKDQEVYLSPKDAADYYARMEKNESALTTKGDLVWMFYRKTKDGWQTTDKAPSKP